MAFKKTKKKNTGAHRRAGKMLPFDRIDPQPLKQFLNQKKKKKQPTKPEVILSSTLVDLLLSFISTKCTASYKIIMFISDSN